ncbi:hypothetical protein [Streptococcus parasanguinis]|uniref:hypothetical protein n=1 Tax=Streptococcus parasanguinis TaxID=1318 RepID=UPI003218FE6E
MDLKELEKALEIRQQIKELEKIINHELTPLEKLSIIRQKPKFRLAVKTVTLFYETQTFITSEILSDAIKEALKQTVKGLKAELKNLGVEVEEVENE